MTPDKAEVKKQVIELLKKLKVIREDFTGKIVLNFNTGGITSYEVTETHR